MANISGDWNKSMPSGSSSIADGDDLLRQHWNSLESTIGQEHAFSSTATLAGYHKPGSARVYTGLSSALSADNLPTDVEEGRLFTELDTGRLFLLGASAQTCISQGIGAFSYKDGSLDIAVGINPAIFDTEYANVAPVSGDDWLTPSGATLTVPSGASGFYFVVASVAKPFGLPSDLSVTDELQIDVQRNGSSVPGLTHGEMKSRTTEEAITIQGIIAFKSQDSISVRLSNTWDTTILSTYVNLIGHKVG